MPENTFYVYHRYRLPSETGAELLKPGINVLSGNFTTKQKITDNT